jgi:hypothetical protein
MKKVLMTMGTWSVLLSSTAFLLAQQSGRRLSCFSRKHQCCCNHEWRRRTRIGRSNHVRWVDKYFRSDERRRGAWLEQRFGFGRG